MRTDNHQEPVWCIREGSSRCQFRPSKIIVKQYRKKSDGVDSQIPPNLLSSQRKMAGKSPTSLFDLLNKIPTKLLVAIVLVVLLFTCSLVGYAVVFQNTPVEIFGILKFGERADELRQRLVNYKQRMNLK